MTAAGHGDDGRELCHRHNAWYAATCWRCHLEARHRGPLEMQFQPKHSRVCGQTCVAMILGEDREDVIKHRFGHRHATSGKALRQVLTDAEKRCSLWQRTKDGQLPDVPLAIVSLRTTHPKAPKNWKHWVVLADGYIYDPSIGVAHQSHARDTLSYDETATYAVSFMEIVQ